MHRHIVIGPPGTGKTTYLKKQVDNLVHNKICSTQEIGYFSFTVRAAEEIRDRVMDKKKWSKDEMKAMFPYFRTLHSLAYDRLDLKQAQIMNEYDYIFLSEQTGNEFVNRMKKGNGVDISMPTAKSEYQDIINLSYAKYPNDEDRLDKVFRHVKINDYGARDKIKQMALDLSNYKKDKDKYEYVDYFIRFLEEQNPPQLKYLFIDEAQDLSAQQWDVVDMIQKKSGALQTYIAGDDDQAIFRWAGADIEHFIRMADRNNENTIIPLTESYRIPISVHTLATKLAQSISQRIPKEYKARPEEGIRKVLNVRPLNKGIQEGEWLILCRTHEIVKSVCDALEQFGWLYKCYGKSVVNLEYITAIRGWTKLSRGEKLSGVVCEIIYKHMDSSRIKRNYGVFKGDQDDVYDLERLIKEYGLKETVTYKTTEINTREAAWYEMLNAKGLVKKITYLRSLLRSGNKIDEEPRIEVSTIHASKGGERQKVMLLADLSYGPYKASIENQQGRDDEARVFYVGATRAKEELYIVQRADPAHFNYEPIFHYERQCR